MFRTYAEEALNDGIGESLPQRFDAAFNYIQHGIDGLGNSDDVTIAAQRTNYFRETYAYGTDIQAPGVEPFFTHPDLLRVASDVTGRALIVPAIVYANILTPGQELAIHTDVPEFRGADRKRMPQWLLVTMLHSGLFDDYRIPIATCVSWFGANPGGAFAYYPEGAQGVRESMAATHNTAILIDTDQVFHGVERVTPKTFFQRSTKERRSPLKEITSGHWSTLMVRRLLNTHGQICDIRFLGRPTVSGMRWNKRSGRQNRTI